jgi:hypothetical protein
MSELKEYILEFVWTGDDVAQFEKWLYLQDSDNFERLLGSDNYVELISYDFKKKTIDQFKKFLKSVIPVEIKKEFDLEFKRREKAIKGKCVKTKAWNPWGNEMRDWELEVGKEYEFIIISKGMKNKKYPPTVNYIDREDYFRPSGFIPAELFEIDLENISDFYHIIETDECEQLIELKDLADKFYKPVNYSFWEDFYDDEDKAVNLYYDTIDRLGIKNVW